MEVDGTPEAALEPFMKAWDARTDDYDASIAAHFVARGIERRLPVLGAWIARNSVAQGRIV
jgi:hypothetical protein